MNEEYYVLEDGEKRGPYTFKELIKEGVDIDTPILEPGSDAWQNASYVPKFAEYFESLGYLFPTEDNLASPGLRTIAFIIDYVLLSVITGLIVIQTGLLKLPPVTDKLTASSLIDSLNGRTMLLLELSFVVVFLIYNLLFETGTLRGSLGKRICGLKVVDADGNNIVLLKCLVRNIGAVTGYSPIGAIIVIISFFVGAHRQTWYERITNSYVIKVS